LGIIFKLSIIAAVFFPVIMTLYEVFARRFDIVRLFIGMRPKKNPAGLPIPRPEESSA